MRKNNIARIYNQFPRRYQYENSTDRLSVIDRMIEDLPRIAKMGCNVIWVNPLALPGGKKMQSGNEVHCSLYAMANGDELNPEFFPPDSTNSDREKLLRQFTQTAIGLRLTPIFDLVINHVANESRQIENEAEARPEERAFKFKGQLYAYYGRYKKHIDWARIQEEEIKNSNKDSRWDDTLPLNYSTDAVIEDLWRPFIHKYMTPVEQGGYGFGGARVDAVVNIERSIHEKVLAIVKEYDNPFVILAELMAFNPVKHVTQLRDTGYTHVLASGTFYWGTKLEELYEEHWLCKQVNVLKPIPIKDRGGIIGILGNHDIGAFRASALLFSKGEFIKEGEVIKYGRRKDPSKVTCTALKLVTANDTINHYQNERTECLSAMKERFFRIALTCNGGYYILAGDEFGVAHRPLVFNHYREPCTVSEKWGAGDSHDITLFLKCMNHILSELPGHDSVAHFKKEETKCLAATVSYGAQKIVVIYNIKDLPINDYVPFVNNNVAQGATIYFINQDQVLSITEAVDNLADHPNRWDAQSGDFINVPDRVLSHGF